MVNGVKQYVDLMAEQGGQPQQRAVQERHRGAERLRQGQGRDADEPEQRRQHPAGGRHEAERLRRRGRSRRPAGGKDIASFVAGINLSVFKNTKNKDAALKLVKFMTSPEEQAILDKPFTALPSSRAAPSTSRRTTEEAKAFADVLATKAEPLPLVPAESSSRPSRQRRQRPVRAGGHGQGGHRRATSRPLCRRPRTRWPRPAADAPTTAMTTTVSANPARVEAPSRRRRRPPSWGKATPYLLVLPAVLLELLIHIIPMLVGIVDELRQAHPVLHRELAAGAVRRAGQLPGRAGLQRPARPGPAALVHRSRSLYTVLVVGLAWTFGMAAALVLQRSFRGRGRPAHAVPRAVRPAHLRRHHHLELHVPAGQRAGQPRPADEPARPGPRDVLADRQQRLLLHGRRRDLAVLAVRVPHADGRAAEHPRRALRGRRRRRRRDLAADAAHHPAAAAAGQPVLLLVLFLWTFNDFNTPFVLFGATPPKSADLISIHIYRQLVRHLELRPGLGDVGAAAAVPAGGHRRLSPRSPNRRTRRA